MAVFVNVCLYQLGWFACVFGAATGHPWFGMGLALGLVGVHLWLSGETRRQLTLIGAAAVIGLTMDSLQLWWGIFRFPSGTNISWLAPLWVGVLWMQFATILPFSLRWLSNRYGLSAVLGFVGGPLAYYAGEKAGAVVFLAPRLPHFAVLAVFWSVALPAIIWVSDRLDLVALIDGRYRFRRRRTMTHPHRVAIIGGGFAGLSAALGLRRTAVDITLVDRRDSDSLKWSDARGDHVIPMWVADMDFGSPECVLRALRERVQQGVFGYPVVTDAVTRAVVAWSESHYRWQIDPQWIVWLPGLVPGIHLACQAFAEAGDEVLTLVPAYPPFLSAPRATGRTIKTVPLVQDGARWTLDLDALSKAIAPRTKLLLFCNPHNPVGRVFGREELSAVAEICERHGLAVCSDEIHCDLMLEPGAHVPFASLGVEIADRTVTLMSPSKTFNLSGLRCGFAVIPNPDLRQRFQTAAGELVPPPNVLGYVACRAAYEHGEAWRLALIDYLRANRDLLEAYFHEQLPLFSVSHVEGTYLAWIDARRLGQRDAIQLFDSAGVRLSDGRLFQGEGFVRLNFGCPRRMLQDALERVSAAVRKTV